MVSIVKKVIKGRPYYYFVWMKREGKKVIRVRQEYIGTAEKLVQRLSQPIPKFKSYSYGELALLLHIAEQTDFVGTVNKHLQKIASIGDYLLLPIINRLLQPTSTAGLNEWYKKSCLPMIWDKDLSVSSQNYWYYLDRLTEDNMAIIWGELLENVKKKLKIEDSEFLFDPTNFFTYIEDHEENKLPQNGMNKQKRNDKNQVNVSLLIGGQSTLPYWYDVYAGNINDKTYFKNSGEKLKERATFYGKENVTLVLDKGSNSGENFKILEKYFFISALIKEKTEARDLLSGDFKFCYKTSKGNDVLAVSKETPIKFCYKTSKGNDVLADSKEVQTYEINCKIVVSSNEQLKKKQLHSLEEKIMKTNEKFKAWESHLFQDEKAAVNKMHEILPKKHNPFDYELKKEGDKIKILLNLNVKKVAWYTLTAGKNIIFTNRLDWDDEKIIRAYRSMHKIEYQFKLLHGALLIPIKPIYHWTDQKIRAHIFLCMTALLFSKVLEYMCKDKIGGNFRQILDFASTIRYAIVQKDGKLQLIPEDFTPEQQTLIDAFSLTRFAK